MHLVVCLRPAADARSLWLAVSAGLGGLIGCYGESDDEGETQGQARPASAGVCAASAPSVDSSSSASDLAEGWSACKDEASGDTYYWNQQTDETSWERPQRDNTKQTPSTPPGMAAAVAPPPGIATAGASPLLALAPAVLAEDSSARAIEVTSPPCDPGQDDVQVPAPKEEGEETDIPMLEAPTSTPAHSVDSTPMPILATELLPAVAVVASLPALESAGIALDAALPPGWQQVVDEASGDTYYWHEPTDQTSWERPTAAAAATTKVEADAPTVNTAASSVEAAPTAPSVAPSAAVPLPAPVASASVPVQLNSAAQSMFVDALLAGLNARMRDGLDLPFFWLMGEGTAREAISPLMHLAARVAWMEEQWKNEQAATATTTTLATSASFILEQLQHLTMDVDRVLAAERAWRMARRMPSKVPPGAAVAAAAAFDSTPPVLEHAPGSGPAAASLGAPSGGPLRTSGAIHPARLGFVGVLSAPASGPPAKKHARDVQSGDTSADGPVGKKAKLGKDMAGLVTKWQQVSEQTAAEREQERLAKQEFFRMEARQAARPGGSGAAGGMPGKDL